MSGRLGGPALALALGLLGAAGLAGCGTGAPDEAPPTPVASSVASPGGSGAIEVTRGAVEAALRTLEIGLIVPTVPYRPAESIALIDVPRGIYQAVLADDPDNGYIAIYEFPDPARAYEAGRVQAAWLGSGPGAVQSPLGTSHVLRQVGNTLVLYAYRPDGPSGSRAVDVATGLVSIGQGIEIPR